MERLLGSSAGGRGAVKRKRGRKVIGFDFLSKIDFWRVGRDYFSRIVVVG